MKMRIGITRNTSNEGKFSKYESWLLKYNPSVEFVEFQYDKGVAADIESCDGLLLTGGDDIDPKFYGMENGRSKVKGAEVKRDEFEFDVIKKAFARKMPVLGVCRGLQSTNVFLGGSLHVDLQSDGFSRHTEIEGKENRHQVKVEEHSMLYGIVGRGNGEVNSSHHQGADMPGKELAVSAKSSDGVIEAMEWVDSKEKPFLLLVQWHPERMKDISNPLAEKIGRTFLGEVTKFKKQK